MASNPLRARACVYLVASADPIVGLGASTFAVKASLLHILREFYLYVSIMTLGCDKTRPRPLQTDYQARVHHAVSLGERGMRCSLPRNDGNRGRGRGEGNRDQGHPVHFLADVGDGGEGGLNAIVAAVNHFSPKAHLARASLLINHTQLG